MIYVRILLLEIIFINTYSHDPNEWQDNNKQMYAFQIYIRH